MLLNVVGSQLNVVRLQV